MKHNHRAFTLVELMVVVCLLMFISHCVIMQFSLLDKILVRIELEKLMNACRYIQQLAIATNKEHSLVFDIYKHEYAFDTYREKLSQRIRFGLLPGVKGSPGSPTHIPQNAITFPACRICFYPTGTISSGTVYLVDVKKQSLYALSNAVSQVSFLRMYRYDGAWKLCGDDKRTW